MPRSLSRKWAEPAARGTIMGGEGPWESLFRGCAARCRPSRCPCTCPAIWRWVRGGKNSNALLPPLLQRVLGHRHLICFSLLRRPMDTLTCDGIKMQLSRFNNKEYKKQYYYEVRRRSIVYISPMSLDHVSLINALSMT
jgi:hypothetical protein